MNHTKGPWKVSYDGDGCRVEFSNGVFNTVPTDSDNDIEELEANANLIAAAPEMLEALEEIIANVKTQQDIEAYTAYLKKIIKKARGES